MPHSATRSRLRRNISSVSVGKPAIRSAPITMSGRKARARARRGDRLRAAVAALHPLQDQVVAGLQRQVQMRHQPRLVGEQPPTARRRSRSGRARTGAAAAVPAPPPAAAAPSGRGSGRPAGRRHRRSGRPRSARSRGSRRRRAARAPRATIASSGTDRLGAARIGDDAEGAAMVAALLHLQISAARALTRLAAPRLPSPQAGERVGAGAVLGPLPPASGAERSGLGAARA